LAASITDSSVKTLPTGCRESVDIAKSFGKGVAFALGLIFLSPIFYCILGFGSAQYQGPAAAR
jgi:hypothetical protein